MTCHFNYAFKRNRKKGRTRIVVLASMSQQGGRKAKNRRKKVGMSACNQPLSTVNPPKKGMLSTTILPRAY